MVFNMFFFGSFERDLGRILKGLGWFPTEIGLLQDVCGAFESERWTVWLGGAEQYYSRILFKLSMNESVVK